MTEESSEDAYQKVNDVAQNADVAIAEDGISVCHRLTISKPGPETIIAKFVTRQTKPYSKKSKRLVKKCT